MTAGSVSWFAAVSSDPALGWVSIVRTLAGPRLSVPRPHAMAAMNSSSEGTVLVAEDEAPPDSLVPAVLLLELIQHLGVKRRRVHAPLPLPWLQAPVDRLLLHYTVDTGDGDQVCEGG